MAVSYTHLDVYKRQEELQLFCKAHGHDQRLIAVPQIHAAPCGSLFNMVFFYPVVITGGYRVCLLYTSKHIFTDGDGAYFWMAFIRPPAEMMFWIKGGKGSAWNRCV